MDKKEDPGVPTASPPPSSFPISSPSFWNEVATSVEGTVKHGKRPATGEDEAAANSQELSSPTRKEDDPYRKEGKRARFASPDLDEGSIRDVTKAEIRQGSNGDGDAHTSLSYFPNRLDPHLFDASNSYLAAPEYAPNKFGDIGDYMRKKEVKVQTQNRDIAMSTADPNLPQIFTGQSFWINGNTHPPMEELRKMILQRGGEVRPKLWNKGYVKYIIAPMLTQMKFKEFKTYKVVKEGWIVESCKEGKMLDWTRWKLQVQGGWEETGRKGLEGFLRGEPSQRVQGVKEEETGDDEGSFESDHDIDAAAGHPDRTTEGLGHVETTARSTTTPTKPKTQTQPAASAATQSLISRAPITPIPISPGYLRAATAAAEGLPAKVHRPEGAWEHYYTKDSNEHAAEALRNSDWRVRNTAERGNEGGFIDGYYQNSRLHHLSTWKAELKVLVAAAQKQSEENALSRPSHSTVQPYSLSTAQLPRSAAPISSSSSSGGKIIFHCDFDCFFVSCGLATRPHLKGKPAVVCHSQTGKNASTSEIASASYEARAKGVKNGMSLGRARQLVGDDLQTIPYEFETYKKFSLAFYTVLMGYADELQAVSVDEALIDVTGAVRAREQAPEEAQEGQDPQVKGPRDAALEIAEKIRHDVRTLTEGCEVSIGISHNVLLAKLATRAAKPAGSYHLTEALAPSFLENLDVKDLPSIGYSTANKIEEKFGTTQCGSLLDIPKSALQKTLGPKTGEMVFGYLRGTDDRKLEPHKERKSISAEMNYGIRFRNQEQAEVCVRDLAAEVAKRLKQINVRGRLLTLKVMSRHPDAPVEPPKFLGHGWCETFNRSASISNKGGSATDDPAILGSESVKLLKAMRLDPVELRGIGIQITKLDGEAAKPVERETGQGLLSFGKKVKGGDVPSVVVELESDLSKELAVSEAAAEQSDPPRPLDAPTKRRLPATDPPVRKMSETASPEPGIVPIHAQVNAVAGPSRIPTSSDGIDPEYLAALPDDLRQEVKRDHAITRAQARARAESERPPAPAVVVDATDERDRATTISPAKTKGMHQAAHITKQLRPRNKTQLRAAAISELPLYGAWNRAAQIDRDQSVDSEILNLTDSGEKVGKYYVKDLRDLGIDPDFLKDLPEEMQKEVVDAEMTRKKQRQILHRPADTSRVRALARARARESISPARSSRAGSAAPAAAHAPRPIGPTISRPSKPKLYNATTLSDVTDIITKWIESRKGSGPAARDANKVQAYLVRCLAPESGLGGTEMAVEVLRFMRVAIDSRWEQGACEDDLAGSEWWSTWAGFRAAVDSLHRERFGAGLRL